MSEAAASDKADKTPELIKADEPQKQAEVKESWWKSSKPTEWISSLAQALGVIALIITGIITLRIGLVDMKVTKLQIDQKELADKENVIKAQITTLETQLKETKESLSSATRKLETINTYQQTLAFLAEMNKDVKVPHIRCYAVLDPGSSLFAVTKIYISIGPFSSGMIDVKQSGLRVDKPKPIVSKDTTPALKAIATLSSIAPIPGLAIEGVQLTAEDLETISSLKGLSSLTLDNCGLDDDLIKHLCTNPVFMFLSYNPFTKPPSINRTNDMALTLTATGVNDESMAAFFTKAPFGFAFLHLDFTPITDKTLDAIQKRGRGVELMDIIGTKVTADGFKRFVKRVEPKYVAVSGDEAARNDYQKFLSENKLRTEIRVHDKKK
jgi:hypothetical protein